MEHPLTNFKASHSWLLKFKAKHGIVSRKINKFVTLLEIKDAEKLMSTAKEFLQNVHETVREKNIKHIYNADQSGFKVAYLSSWFQKIHF